jgi:hypothetical protein
MPWPAGKPTRRLLEEAENNLGQKPYPRIAKAENQFQANQVLPSTLCGSRKWEET